MSIVVQVVEEVVQATVVEDVVRVTVQEISTPTVITIAEQGPAGPPGPPGSGGGASFFGTSGTILFGHRLVEYASDGTLIHSTGINAVGLTNASASPGTSVEVFPAGPLVEPSWNWTPGQPIFQTGVGQLTQTPPTTGFIRQIGIAQNSTSIIIDLQPATILI